MPVGMRIVGAPVVKLVRNAYVTTNVPLIVQEKDTFTLAAKASTGDGDYCVVYDTAGNGWAVALDTTGGAANTPTGAVWVSIAAARKVYYDISGTTTAASVATAVAAAFNSLSGFSTVITAAPSSATVVCTAVNYNTVTAPGVHNKGDTGAGSITVAITNAGVGYTTMVTAMPSGASRLYVYDNSGSTLALTTGAAGAEVVQLYIPPGGMPMTFDVLFPYNARIAVGALDTAATTNQLLLQFIGGPQ